MEDHSRTEFKRLKELASTLESDLSGLEGQFSDIASTLTLSPSEKDRKEANEILDGLVDYWKNLCEKIQGATVQMDTENAELSENLKKAETSLNALEERKEKNMKYVTENLNVNLGKLKTASNQELNKSSDGDSPSSQSGLSGISKPEDNDTTFRLPQRFTGLQMSPGDDNTDNTVLEFK